MRMTWLMVSFKRKGFAALANCDLWMHEDCLSVEGETYVCVLCNAMLN